jgi:hypothetical protein
MNSIDDFEQEVCQRFWWTCFSKGIAWFLAQIVLITSIMIPHNNALAGTTTWSKPTPTGAALGNWSEFAALPQNWVERPDPTWGFSQPIMVPKDNFALIGAADWVPPSANQTAAQRAAIDWQMLIGDKWITLGRESIGQTGLRASNKIE